MQSCISRYWLTFILIFILAVLLYQNFFINHFPFSLIKKQSIVDQEVRNNQHLKQKNKIKSIKSFSNLRYCLGCWAFIRDPMPLAGTIRKC
jgi:type II secretory pathway component PulC